MNKNWEDKPFGDHLLYVVDGELLNHMIRIMRVFKKSPDLPETYDKILTYVIKSIIQCVNYPTGEVVDSLTDIDETDIDEIGFEEFLWRSGIRLPNSDDSNNQYPDEDL